MTACLGGLCLAVFPPGGSSPVHGGTVRRTMGPHDADGQSKGPKRTTTETRCAWTERPRPETPPHGRGSHSLPIRVTVPGRAGGVRREHVIGHARLRKREQSLRLGEIAALGRDLVPRADCCPHFRGKMRCGPQTGCGNFPAFVSIATLERTPAELFAERCPGRPRAPVMLEDGGEGPPEPGKGVRGGEGARAGVPFMGRGYSVRDSGGLTFRGDKTGSP